MSIFDKAKHKVEEVVGKFEETVGAAVGDQAMEFDGHVHHEHGEAALENDEAREAAERAAESDQAEG